jgi:hypothetical protein
MSQRHRALGSVILAAAAACAGGTRSAVDTPSPAATSVAPDPAIEAVRRQVVNGSIIADMQLGRIPPMAVGACVDPVASARWELDRSLDFTPDHPPVVVGAFPLPPLPESLRDSEVRTGVVTARWVVDTIGTAIPGSVSIVASPHGLMSVQVCGAVLTAHFTPATDDGRRVRARVEMPVRFVQ